MITGRDYPVDVRTVRTMGETHKRIGGFIHPAAQAGFDAVLVKIAIDNCKANCLQYADGVEMAIYRRETRLGNSYRALEYRAGDETHPDFVCKVV